MIYWPRTGEQFADAAYAMAQRASDARMSTAALKRELALLRSSLAALTPAQSAALDDPVAWAERPIVELALDPGSGMCCSGRSAIAAECHAAKRQEHISGAQGCLDGAAGRPAVAVSPSLRQSGFLFRKLADEHPRRLRGRLPARDDD